MEIIKHGKEYKEHTCDLCGCVFSYLPSDKKTNVRMDEVFSEWHYVHHEYIICPECHKQHSLIYLIDEEDQLK